MKSRSDSSADRLPPQNLEAEVAVLGSMLLDNAVIPDVTDILKREDFYSADHQVIYEAIVELFGQGKPADLVTLTEALKAKRHLERIGGPDYLVDLVEKVPSTAQAQHYGRIVAGHARRRRLAQAAERLRQKALDPTVDDQEVGEAVERVVVEGNGHFAGGEVGLTVLADVAPQEVRWLWPWRIPLGKLSLVAGNPGVGKSVLALDLVSRVTAGLDWPDGAGPAAIGNVLILSAEDDPADTIRPRLDAAGGNARRVVVVEAIRDGDGERLFSLERDIRTLEATIERVGGVSLIIIDPVSVYLGSRIDAHRDADVRRVLSPLATVAARHGVGIVAVMHLNKKSDASPIYRVLGSVGFVAAARVVWAVVRDKHERRRRLLAPIKANLAPDVGGLAFVIESDPESGQPVLAWERQAVDVAVEDALEEVSPAEREVVRWLRELLRHGPMAAKEVAREAKAAGFSMTTIRRVKGLAGVEVRKSNFGGGWYWGLKW